MSTASSRADIVEVGRSLFERGYVHASAGNISVRLADGFLITPTDAPLGFLEADSLAECDTEGNQLSGDRASKTLTLHRRIYDQVTTAGCVLHTHATHLVALSLAGVWRQADILPPITPYFVMKVGHVPLISYRRPGDPEVADLVAAHLAEHPRARAVMLDRLGPLVWGPTPREAMAILEELEETARLWLLNGRSVEPLPEAAIADLIDTFDAPW